MESETKTCQNCKNSFVIEPDDFSFYEKIKVPPPTFCPECRLQRRFAWRNECIFYKTKCGLCKKNTITNNPPLSNFPIYCSECWHGDKWEARDYGKDYDFSKPFFLQWKELLERTPNINLWGIGNLNSEYSNYTGYSKNIYLSNATNCEDVYYSRLVDRSKNLVDCYYTTGSEFCYENFITKKIYNSSFLNNCSDCVDSYFLFDCKNCSNCFMCSNLRNKNYYIRNKQYTRETYGEELKNYKLSSFKKLEEYKSEFDNLIKEKIHKFANITNSVDVTGDNIINSKNTHDCFMVEGENLKYCWRCFNKIKDSYDITGGLNNELCYESSLAADGGYMTKFFSHSRGNKNSDLVHLCINCSNIFGCVGLKNKKYYILNKEYSKEEYTELIPKIIKHMNDMPYIDSKGRVYKYGEFFPSELSPFNYNDTVAQEFFPLIKEKVLDEGYKWEEKEQRNYIVDIKSEDIEDDINNIDIGICDKIIECGHLDNNKHTDVCKSSCTEAFKITKEEFQFYKRMNLPLPRLCANCRYGERIKQRNPPKLWHRKCMNKGCNNEFETSYAPERPEIIYCEYCYQKEVY
ncbi:MAG TPA: hypothetical protein VK153_03400 [Candidatus Paceibacterota bacterium]|nr:hypothetical protein [Candidatus Paceibacterota bacterium]